LFTLSVLALALGIAFGAVELFDVSFALGAFFAGMVLNESELRGSPYAVHPLSAHPAGAAMPSAYVLQAKEEPRQPGTSVRHNRP
ncbi:hypothetical protein ONJ17_25600, partial [Salmonella enterica subsp. enterica serovar Agona]|nr:hypothetical protein [Salmonella enterica subsp. enterica serovar Agona]